MHVFNIAEIFGKQGSDNDDLTICVNNKAKENIHECCNTRNGNKMLANRINKRRQVKGKNMFLMK